MFNNRTDVIIVNEKDEWLGTVEKLRAHEEGVLHRAFSVFLLNDNNELLLQKRASDKYHSGGLWTNTCCSHPHPGESTAAAAKRRLVEEMGISGCELKSIFDLRYKSDVGNGLIENEYDHVYIGYYNGTIKLNPDEADDYKYVSLEEVEEWIANEPELFTEWFKLALPKFMKYAKADQLAA